MVEPVLPILIYLCGGVAVATFTYLFMLARGAGEVVRGSDDPRDALVQSPIMQLVLRLSRVIAPIFAKTADSKSGRELDRKLGQAGRPLGMTVPEFHASRVVGAVLGWGLGYFGSVVVFEEPSIGLMIFLAIFGFWYPSQKLSTTIRLRHQQIFRDLPYILEMLTLSTEAGQDFSSAMGTVIEKGTPGAMLEEFKIVHQEITLGKTRADALRAMAKRIDLPEVTSFVLALIQAEQLGTSIGKVLRIMADQMRIKRSQIAEELAGKVPVKLMAPLITCIVPASFIILLFGPIYMYMTGQELGGG